MQKMIMLALIGLIIVIAGCTQQQIEKTAGIAPVQEVIEDTPLAYNEEAFTCTDADNDGFCQDTDCNDNNSQINPNAEPICGDGKDNDCSGKDTICPKQDTKDSDYDGLSDLEELTTGTDPELWDTDRDGLGDGEEITAFNTDPTIYDTDGDGWADGGERTIGTDPTNFLSKPQDDDNDLLENAWERQKFSNSLSYRGNDDPDKDDLNTLYEFNLNTHPNDADSDNDQLWDNYELFISFTDPRISDTDGDGYDDGLERIERSDPRDQTSVPHTVFNRNRAQNNWTNFRKIQAEWL